ncbi:hypothetical protein A2U01_0024540 [Trifolium medium]|uniref:Uncharacterized protein n=1 Tax=Trifolium medium TaxID=97028 RepID=A0A392NWB5_9FABA|nr:hypothetical protein [Trifolium medium]
MLFAREPRRAKPQERDSSGFGRGYEGTVFECAKCDIDVKKMKRSCCWENLFGVGTLLGLGNSNSIWIKMRINMVHKV